MYDRNRAKLIYNWLNKEYDDLNRLCRELLLHLKWWYNEEWSYIDELYKCPELKPFVINLQRSYLTWHAMLFSVQLKEEASLFSETDIERAMMSMVRNFVHMVDIYLDGEPEQIVA